MSVSSSIKENMLSLPSFPYWRFGVGNPVENVQLGAEDHLGEAPHVPVGRLHHQGVNDAVQRGHEP